ncbi:MAG TPA: creatininase family protein [Dehalococcoidia bacterium]|nr:creatininase family protein [Dehalococcoidia bacterium]
MKKVLWQELRRPEFEEAVKADAIVIIPVASTEQHGNHLPVNTDANCCFAIAQRAAQAIDEFPVLVLPPIWTGYSPHHMDYPGTITLKYHTLVELLTQVAASIHAHGFKKILFLNGHGGNAAVVAAMQLKLADEEGVPSLGYTYWDMPAVPEQMKAISQSDKGSIGHSGEMETPLQLYLQPELVDMAAATWVPGVMGDPSAGTREKGERIVNAAVDALVKILRDYHSGSLEDRLIWRKEIL